MLTDAEVAAMVKASAEGCCMNDAWRGHACDYHQGYDDGIEAALSEVRRRTGAAAD